MTYTNPARWLPAFRPLDADLALRTLLTRYLYAYGPATPQHVAKWLAISPRSATDLFGRLSADLERVDLDGTPAWTLAADTQTPAEPWRHPPAALLRRIRGCGPAPGPAVSGRGRSPRALTGRPGRKTTRSCSSTALWAASGTRAALAAGWPSLLNPCES